MEWNENGEAAEDDADQLRTALLYIIIYIYIYIYVHIEREMYMYDISIQCVYIYIYIYIYMYGGLVNIIVYQSILKYIVLLWYRL